MDPDLKEMLDRRAEDMRLAPDLPSATFRRARRRRGWSVALASMTVLAVVAGTVVALQAFGTTTTRRIGQSPTPPAPTQTTPPPLAPGDFVVPAIWPEATLSAIDSEQARVDAGADPWRTDTVQTAQHFAVSVLGWTEATATVVPGDGSPSTVVTVIPISQGLADPSVGIRLSMSQLARQGSDGIWSVVDVFPSSFMSFEAGPGSGGGACPADQIVPGEPASLCGNYLSSTTIRYALFEADDVELARPDTAPVYGDIPASSNGDFAGGMTENVSADAAVLFIEAVDQFGDVVTAASNRVATSPPATSAPSTNGPGAPTAIDRAVWPVVTPARLDDLGQQVAEGKADYALQPDTAAKEFAVRMLGWSRDRVTVEGIADGIPYRSIPGVQAIVQNADLGPSTELVAHLEPATVGGRTVWLVVGVKSGLFDLRCPPPNTPTLDTSTPLHVCGTLHGAPVGTTATATVEYVESELQQSEAQSLADLSVTGNQLDGELPFIADYANSDVALVVRLVGPDGTVLGMEARRLHVG